MIPELRRDFNRRFTPQDYARLLACIERRCGVPIKFRISETPCFFPPALLQQMEAHGRELILQLVENPQYMRISDATIPPEYNVPGEPPRPMFVQVDFGLVRGEEGAMEPKLVELQAFPSLYAYQPALAEEYVAAYGLDASLQTFLPPLERAAYDELLRRCILGRHAPENVVLLEIDPAEQKTLPDFILTEQLTGVRTVNLRDVVQQGSKLHYRRDGLLVPIHRIYNRVILEDVLRDNAQLPFDYRDDLQVEWAGHPNWYFRISKFSIPHLRHACVPRTWFLDQLEAAASGAGSRLVLPGPRDNYLLKPLYSFAGAGIVFAPGDEQLAAIPREQRHNYIVQERMHFAPVIETPHGGTQVEIRMMFLWPEDGPLTAVTTLLRMGRGKMMGVDHNRNLEWVGSSAGLWPRA